MLKIGAQCLWWPRCSVFVFFTNQLYQRQRWWRWKQNQTTLLYNILAAVFNVVVCQQQMFFVTYSTPLACVFESSIHKTGLVCSLCKRKLFSFCSCIFLFRVKQWKKFSELSWLYALVLCCILNFFFRFFFTLQHRNTSSLHTCTLAHSPGRDHFDSRISFSNEASTYYFFSLLFLFRCGVYAIVTVVVFGFSKRLHK